MNIDEQIENKMRQQKLPQASITSFLRAVNAARSGAGGLIPENTIEPVSSLPALERLRPSRLDASEVVSELAVIKLNGGLGTSMGLDRAKSLIKVKEDDTF